MFEYEKVKIKDCPFCGGKAHLYNNFCYTHAYVKCSRCGVRTKEYKSKN